MEQKTMAIEITGTIGAGKSTVCAGLQKKGLRVVKEPSDTKEWEEAINLFYSDQRKYAYLFQTVAFTLRSRAWRDVLSGKYGPPDFVVVERTVYTDKHVFAYMLGSGDDPLMSDIEYRAYLRLWDELPHSQLVKPAAIMYLKVPPGVALDRIKKRGRKSEIGITLEYLVALEKAHERYIDIMWKEARIFEIDARDEEKKVADEVASNIAFVEEAIAYERSR